MSDVSPRARRLADRIKVVVAETLEFKVKDPRLGFITITDAHITNDLREAKVYYTVFGDQTQADETAAALESAKGMIRSEVGKATGVRHTPSIEFVADAVPAEAAKIDSLLEQARQSDEALAKRREGGQFAGDANPYDD
ncbi:MAG: 30S ribosome-binding factor RbfA [Candidatus Nanopelagicales bacterium]